MMDITKSTSVHLPRILTLELCLLYHTKRFEKKNYVQKCNIKILLSFYGIKYSVTYATLHIIYSMEYNAYCVSMIQRDTLNI